MEESKEFELCGVTLISTTLGSDKFRDKAMVKLLFYVNRFVFLCSWFMVVEPSESFSLLVTISLV